MANNINVREILGVEQESLFMKDFGPNKTEAMKRLVYTEACFEKWHMAINKTHTKDCPAEIVRLYDEAALALCKIIAAEKAIVTK